MRGKSLISAVGAQQLGVACVRGLLIVLATASLDACTKRSVDGRGSIPESQTAHELVSDLRQRFSAARATYVKQAQTAATQHRGAATATLTVPAHQASLGKVSPASEGPVLPTGVPMGFVRDGAFIRPTLPATAVVSRRPASLALPATGSGAFRLTDDLSSMAVNAAVTGAADAPAQVADGYVVYHGILGPGVDLLHRATSEGTEDYFSFSRAPTSAEVRYTVGIDSSVAGLRLAPGSNTLEFLDAGGVPRIRVAPPYVLGADGARHDARLSLSGCAVDTRAAAPFGRAVTPAGASSCTVSVTWDGAAVQYPAVVDPAWTTTSSSPTPRYGAWSATLADGRVLVAGGDNNSGGLASADIFDPVSATWSATGNMNVPRSNYVSQAQVLKDGRVLVASGCCDVDGGPSATGTAELYDSATGTWSFTGNPNLRRMYAQLVPLKDGRVLSVAGYNLDGTIPGGAEIYDPAKGIWTLTASMAAHRYSPAVARLGDGRVLVAGGQDEAGPLDSVEIYNPATGTWAAAPALPAGATTGPSAIGMQDGRVLVVGGSTSALQSDGTYDYTSAATGFVFDGTAWTSTGPLTVRRDSGAVLISLRSGRVLLVGGSQNRMLAGVTDRVGSINVAERLDPGTLQWVHIDDAPYSSFNAASSALKDGAVFMTGGYDYRCDTVSGVLTCVDNGYLTDTAVMEADVKPQGAVCANSFECGTGQCVDGVCCENACGACGVCSVAKGGTKDGSCTPVPAGASKDVCSAYLCDGQATSCPASCSSSSACIAADYCDPSRQCRLDDVPPALHLPASIGVEAAGPLGAVVTWTASADDNADGARPVSCDPASGATFPLGATAVTCSARDTRGNVATASFKVTVIDSTPPVLSVPVAVATEATGSDGAVVTFVATASDLVDGAVATSCLPSSGSVFAVGDTVVSCSASDAHGNNATAAFTVSIKDQTAPRLALPGDVVAEATSASGATASFTASAFDTVDGAVATDCSPASGATFALGISTVTCSATDAHGNRSSGTFNVTVEDTTPPRLIVSDPIRAPATSTGGATVSYAAAANDLVDGAITPVCTPGSASTFALGTTTVSCSASDTRSNVALASFTVTVYDATPPTASLDATPSYTNQSSLTVSGVAKDDVQLASVVLVVNGVDGTAVPVDASGAFSALAALSEGKNTVVARVTDSSGNVSGSTPADIVLDSQPPALSVSAPVADHAYGSTTIEVRAQVSDATPATVSANGIALSIDPTTQVAQGSVVVAGQGPQTVNLLATDSAGNTAAVQVQVLVDLRAPVLSTSLQDGVLGAQPGNAVTAQFAVQDQAASTVTYSFGGPSSFPRGGGSETRAVPLAEGVNVVSMSATNEVGLTSTLARTLVYDTTPPEGVFAIPVPGTWVRHTVELTATASDSSSGVAGVTFSVDQATPLTGVAAADGAFMAEFDTRTVRDGSHGLRATLTDAAGNARAIDTALLVDNTPPTVSVTSPATGSVVKGLISIVVTGSDASSGVASIEVRVNGRSIGSCPASPCTVSYDTRTQLDGLALIEAIATDNAQNVTTAKGVVVVKNARRKKYLESPVDGATATSSVTVTTAIDDPAFSNVECWVGSGSLGRSTNAKFSQSVGLATQLDGPLLVQCGATDAYGNVTPDSATVVVKRWTIEVEPGVLNLKSSGKNSIGVEVSGPYAANLVPLAKAAGLTLSLTGAAPIPLTFKSSSSGANGDEVHLLVNRNAAISAIRTALSVGAIDLRKPLVVRLIGAGKVIGTLSAVARKACDAHGEHCD